MADVRYTWTQSAPLPTQSAVDHYELEYATVSGEWNMADANVPSTELEYTFEDLPPGGVELSVRSVDADGDKSIRIILPHLAEDRIPPAPTTGNATNV